ncbi:UDP-N-acetylglucosamine 4-epimerase (plasmid) [Roseobacter fucihabitans]|uniref:UDP-N-acetylglucosamine 4-epimerase n=1 Tax=Roseobacter fucihabitans TaxID=1537242 RepID=A0ABZ2C1K4_9RHOB|nr:NAD-dependent epimerase/dehydratase family protein [Roseobacter litoralis]MBC6966900.1 dTDP-glucose 4,6-dehydratase [Roseobacter litoralis]
MDTAPQFEKCTITGAAGFIGAHLARALITQGAQAVSGIDNLLYGDWANLGSFSDKVETTTSDIALMDEEQMARALGGTDTLFHFAAQKLNNLTSEADLLASNVVATERLARVAARVGVRRIIFASSLYAYGRHSGTAVSETDVPEPGTLYGVSKLTGEGILRTMALGEGIETVSLRLFFVFGPRQYAGTGYPSVIVRNFSRMMKGEAPTIRGNGDQSLDYTYIDDFVDAILRAAYAPCSGQIINLGSGKSTSINRLTAMMREVCGCRLDPLHIEADWTEGTDRFADVSKAEKLLSWRASTSLEAGLENTYRWLKDKS